MNRGIIEARKIVDELYITKPNEYSIEDIINAVEGPMVIYEKMNNAEGSIVHGEKHSIIKINSNLKGLGRIRFTIAHEFGHYNLHKGNKYFVDTSKTLMEWTEKSKNEYKRIESEANYFAAELLMPEDVFKEQTKRRKFDISLITELSELFETSITSTAIRFTEVGYDPVLLVCVKDREIKWFKKNKDFHFFVDIKPGEVVKNTTVAYDIFEGKTVSKAEEIDPKDWGINDNYNKYNFFEQCIDLSYYGYVLSFISVRS